MRLATATPREQLFAQWQLDVGQGKHTDPVGNVTLLPEMSLPSNSVDALINYIYPGIQQLPHPPDHFFAERAILSARNDDVDSFNSMILNKFPGEVCLYHSADTTENPGNQVTLMYPAEYLNSINVSGLPLSKLALKVGCTVMVLRNLNPQQGVCNGSRGVVTWMTA